MCPIISGILSAETTRDYVGVAPAMSQMYDGSSMPPSLLEYERAYVVSDLDSGFLFYVGSSSPSTCRVRSIPLTAEVIHALILQISQSATSLNSFSCFLNHWIPEPFHEAVF